MVCTRARARPRVSLRETMPGGPAKEKPGEPGIETLRRTKSRVRSLGEGYATVSSFPRPLVPAKAGRESSVVRRKTLGPRVRGDDGVGDAVRQSVSSTSIGAAGTFRFLCGRRAAARALSVPAGAALRFLAGRRGVLAVDGHAAERVEGFPRDTGRVGHPILVRSRVAAAHILLGDDGAVRGGELTVNRFELRV